MIFLCERLDRDSEMKREELEARERDREAREHDREARERERLDILKQNQALQTQQSQLLQVITQSSSSWLIYYQKSKCCVCLYIVYSVELWIKLTLYHLICIF